MKNNIESWNIPVFLDAIHELDIDFFKFNPCQGQHQGQLYLLIIHYSLVSNGGINISFNDKYLLKNTNDGVTRITQNFVKFGKTSRNLATNKFLYMKIICPDLVNLPVKCTNLLYSSSLKFNLNSASLIFLRLSTF